MKLWVGRIARLCCSPNVELPLGQGVARGVACLGAAGEDGAHLARAGNSHAKSLERAVAIDYLLARHGFAVRDCLVGKDDGRYGPSRYSFRMQE